MCIRDRVSAIGQEKITEDAFRRGADYYIMKPFDKDIIVNRIKMVKRDNHKKAQEIRSVSAYEDVRQFSKRTLENDVTNIIHEIGVPAHIKGYQYLRAVSYTHLDVYKRQLISLLLLSGVVVKETRYYLWEKRLNEEARPEDDPAGHGGE